MVEKKKSLTAGLEFAGQKSEEGILLKGGGPGDVELLQKKGKGISA